MDPLTLKQLEGLTQAEKLELAGRWAGADGRVMDGIWRTESSRGTQMLSPAGARGHFGLMPATTATWSQRLGFEIDPDNFDHSLIAASYTLRENLGRFGNLPDGLRAYNGGWDRSRWNNPETAAYVGKVLGGDADPVTPGSRPRQSAPAPRPQTPIANVSALDPDAVLSGGIRPAGPTFPGARPASQLDPDAVLAGRPGDYGNYRPPERRRVNVSEGERFIRSFGGFRPFADPNAQSTTGILEVGAGYSGSVVATANEELKNPVEQFATGVLVNTITGNLTIAVMDSIDEGLPKRDDGFNYEDHMEQIEAGRSPRQIRELRERSLSLEHAEQLRERQDVEAERREFVGDNLWMNLGSGLIDPAGALLGAGLGKAFQGVGVGSRVLFGQGRRGLGTASIVAEGAAGNLIGTGIIDRIGGSYQAPEDYATSALFGSLISVASIPLVSRSSLQEARINTTAAAVRDAGLAEEISVLDEAVGLVGPDAPVQALESAAQTVRVNRVADTINDSFSPVPERNRLFSPEDAEDIDIEARIARLTELGGDVISDDMQRTLIGQLVERSEAIVRNNPIGENVGGPDVLRRLNLASTGETMLRSQDPVMQAVGLTLTEGTTGRGGRRHSAAITQAMEERRFLRPILNYEDAFNIYRETKGVGPMRHAFGDGETRRQFDIEVAAEMRARARPDLYVSSAPASVRQAADYMSSGYSLMGEAQVKAGTLGSQNITPGDPSYFPQHVSSAKVQRLTEPQKAAFRGIVSEQARTMFGWDQKFSDYFGRRYLESAVDRAAGNYDVPVNLTHQSASGFVQDLLDTMRQGADAGTIARIDKASQKFARGGAGFTKGRINFDVMSTYTLEDGTKVKLLDIMDTDMVGMYRAYARRASGEIALQQYGIAGAHGLKTVRKYLAVAHDAGRVTNTELEAFDQIAAEFLNSPFGKHQGVFMDNLRVMTSVIKLGGMGITQFGEYGNGLAVLGAGRVMHAIKDIPRLMKEVGTIRKGGQVDGLLRSLELQQGYETGLDSWIMTRALDVKDNDVQMYGREGMGLGSRVIRGSSHAQAILSGHRIVTAVQTRGMSEQIIRKAFKFIRDGKEDTALKDMGFSPELRKAISDNMDKIATFKDGEVVSLDIFAGDLTPAQRAELTGVVTRGASQIIQHTFIGETGAWAHDGFLKLLFQFRTFSLTAVEKQWGRNLRNYGALKSFMFLMGAMSFAAPIHMARVHARMLGMNEDDREEYAAKYLTPAAIAQATMTYASAAGFGGDIWDIGGSMTTNILGDAAPEWVQGTVNPRGGARSQGRVLGGVVAPSAAIVEDIYGLANGDIGRLKSLMPGANLPYVVPLLNSLESATSED